MATRSTKALYSAENVAKYLIYLASQDFVGDNKEREGITNLKLQKVLYFVQLILLNSASRFLVATLRRGDWDPLCQTYTTNINLLGAGQLLTKRTNQPFR